jgi:hypothetical protein
MTVLQKVNLGTAPAGSDGDAVRTAFIKDNANVDVLNSQTFLTSATLITTVQALTTVHIGKRVNINLSTAGTINLPAASTCAVDQVTLLRNTGTTVVTLAIATGSGDNVSVSKLNPGETALMDTDGVHTWTCLMRGRTNSDNEAVNGNLTVGGVIAFSDGSKQTTSAPSRNYLDNAGGLINTRSYVSGTATTAANQYTLDRWRVVASGQNLQFTTGVGTAQTMTAPAGGVEQLTDAYGMDGGVFTLSWTGTATATVNGASVANGAAVTIPANSYTSVKFFSGTFSKPQLTKGTAAVPFVPANIATDVAVCSRYCRVVRYDDTGYSPAGAGMLRNIPLGLPMNATPSVTVITTPSYVGLASPPVITPTVGFLIVNFLQGGAAGAYSISNYTMLLSADF